MPSAVRAPPRKGALHLCSHSAGGNLITFPGRECFGNAVPSSMCSGTTLFVTTEGRMNFGGGLAVSVPVHQQTPVPILLPCL